MSVNPALFDCLNLSLAAGRLGHAPLRLVQNPIDLFPLLDAMGPHHLDGTSPPPAQMQRKSSGSKLEELSPKLEPALNLLPSKEDIIGSQRDLFQFVETLQGLSSSEILKKEILYAISPNSFCLYNPFMNDLQVNP